LRSSGVAASLPCAPTRSLPEPHHDAIRLALDPSPDSRLAAVGRRLRCPGSRSGRGQAGGCLWRSHGAAARAGGAGVGHRGGWRGGPRGDRQAGSYDQGRPGRAMEGDVGGDAGRGTASTGRAGCQHAECPGRAGRRGVVGQWPEQHGDDGGTLPGRPGRTGGGRPSEDPDVHRQEVRAAGTVRGLPGLVAGLQSRDGGGVLGHRLLLRSTPAQGTGRSCRVDQLVVGWDGDRGVDQPGGAAAGQSPGPGVCSVEEQARAESQQARQSLQRDDPAAGRLRHPGSDLVPG